jgi:hypothetical protein
MHITLEKLLKLLAIGGTGGIAHLVGRPDVTVSDDAVNLWSAVETSVRANQALSFLIGLELTKGA